MPDPIISVRHLTRTFGRTVALEDVSLDVAPGIVYGLVGENGAGKTTLIKHVLGLLRAEQGSIRVFGRDPVEDPVGVLSRIGYLSEDRDMPDWMRVGQFMNYMRAFFPDWDPAFAEELREMFELDAKQKVKTLSRGQRARAGLLAALAHRPDLLLLDEPSSGLDPIVRRDILSAIVRTVADEGRTVLFSSHLLDEVERVADRVAMVDAGRIVLEESLETVLAIHRRITLRFDEARTALPSLPGVLWGEGEGREWTVLANGHSDQLKQVAAESGAEIVAEMGASLEEIFMARVRSH